MNDEEVRKWRGDNVALTTDGKAKPYQHGGTERAVATLTLMGTGLYNSSLDELDETNQSILSDEDIAEIFHMKKEDEYYEILE